MDRHDNGDGSGGILGSTDCHIAVDYQDIDFETEKLPQHFRDFFRLSCRISLLDDYVLTLAISQLLHPSLKSSEPVLVGFGRGRRQIAYPMHLARLLRPGDHSSGEQHDGNED